MKRFVAILCTIILVSCSKESEVERSDLVGVWVTNQGLLNSEIEQVTFYEFRNDGSLEVLTVYQTINKELIGYRYRATGTYAIDNNNLLLNMERIFINDDTQGDYVLSQDDLTVSEDTWIQTFGVSFQDNGKAMTFDYGPCNDTGNCIRFLNLVKTS